MKIRTASSILSIGGLVGLVLLGSSLVFAQEGTKSGGALNTDPFVKRSPGASPVAANSVAANPFADGDAGGSSAGATTRLAMGEKAAAGPGRGQMIRLGGEAEAELFNDPFGPEQIPSVNKIAEVVEPVVLLEYIRTDLATANELLQEFGGLEDVTPLRDRLGEMLEDGGAELVETSFLRTVSGMRMKTESMREYIYPTEFNVPFTPQQFEGKQASMPIASVSPNAFDMRPVGTVVEIEAVVGAGESGARDINVNIAPEIVRYLGDRSNGSRWDS